MRTTLKFVLLFCSFFIAASGLAQAAKYGNPHLLVSPRQVKENISKANWVAVDCRPLKDYAKGHIPGAISLGKRCDKALRDTTARMFRNPQKYEKIFGKVGIGNDTHVVFYHGDIKTITRATVAFWIMEVMGHDKVHLLNGGLEAWNKAGYRLDSKPTMKSAKTFKAKPVWSRYASTDEIGKIAKGQKKNVNLIDSRTKKEYEGKDIRALRGGHVPNVTLNVSHVDTLVKKKGKGGAMVPTGYIDADILDAKFGKLDKNRRTIAYCQTGTRSTLTYLELRLMGFKDPANWDESWRVYGSHYLDLPVDGEQWFDFNKVRKLEKKVKKLEKVLSAKK